MKNLNEFAENYYSLIRLPQIITDNIELILLFLYSFKNCLSIDLKKDEKVFWGSTITILRTIIQNILRKKVNIVILPTTSKETTLFFSKVKLNNSDLINDFKRGRLFGFPKCCIKKYISEGKEDPPSFNSAKRYIDQFRKLGLKEDVFGVNLSCTSGVIQKYGFIPCHPKCKEAIKIHKNYLKIKQKIEKLR